MPIVPERRRQADRTEHAQAALRDAALELILAEGIENLTLASVGARAGFSRGHVGYHFGSKSGLIASLLEDAVQQFTSIYEVDVPLARDVLPRALSRLAEAVRENPDRALAGLILLNDCTASSDPALRARVAEYNRRVRDLILKLLSADPFCPPGLRDPHIGALFLGGVRGMGQQWLVERDQFDIVGALEALGRFSAKMAD